MNIGRSEISILFIILKQDTIQYNQIKKAIRSGDSAVLKAIHVLEDVNLIVEKRGKFNARIFSLTEKGKEVVKALKFVESLIEDNLDQEKIFLYSLDHPLEKLNERIEALEKQVQQLQAEKNFDERKKGDN